MIHRIILAAMLPLLLLTGCYKQAESSSRPSNGEFEVQKLFEHQGCTVYRFYHSGYRYYTRCKSDVTTTWNESCGKNCTRSVSVPTQEIPQ